MPPAKYTGDKPDMGQIVHFKLLVCLSYKKRMRNGDIGCEWPLLNL